MKNIISLFIRTTSIFILITLSSCGSGLGTAIGNCDSEDLNNRGDAFLNAAVVYSQDPSPENCRAYKKTLEDYAELVKDCSLVGRDAKSEVDDAIAELDC